jgi:hypothetical protein
MIKPRRIKWAGHVRVETYIRNFFGKPEGKRPLARPRRRWEDNIKMDIREVGWEGLD